jgi:OOP family OmpA-OmpF porin
MKKVTIIAAALAALSGGLSAGALAQTPNYYPSWYVAPSINAMDPDNLFGVDDTGWGGGLRFGKAVSPMWDIQFGPTYSRSSDGGGRYEQTTLGVDALYMFSRERFRPFVMIGAGAQYDKLRTPGVGNRSETSPYISAGLGFQYGLNDRWSMQADVRRVHGFIRDNAFGPDDRSDNNYVTVGLMYAFDGPTPTQVVRPAEPAPMPVAQPAPAPAPAPAPRFEKVTLSATELFAFDSDRLSMPQPKLDRIAQALSADTSINNVAVIGYTDRLGSEQYNMGLSQRRANAVKSYLTSKGVSPNRVMAEGRGESNPVVNCNNRNRTELIKCLEPNRRVEVEEFTIERRVR